MAQTKAAQFSNRPPSQSMLPTGGNVAQAAMQAGASGVPIEMLLAPSERQLRQLGAEAQKEEKIAGAKEKRAITSEAKLEQLRQKPEQIRAASKEKIERAFGAGAIGLGRQLLAAELQKRKEIEAQNKAELRQAAGKGQDAFFEFLEANPDMQFDAETLNEAYGAIPSVVKERALAREAFKQTPVDFSRGEDYRRALAQRALQESPEMQAEAALRSLVPMDQRAPAVFRPEFRQPQQPQLEPRDINAQALQDMMGARAASQVNLGALELAQSPESILNPAGSRAVGAAAKSLQLREGAEGAEVLEVQKAISALPGFETVELIPGVYDEATKDAVRAYQRSRGLDADGVLGPRTYESLFVDLYRLAESQELDALNQAAMQSRAVQANEQQRAAAAARQLQQLGGYALPNQQQDLVRRILGGM